MRASIFSSLLALLIPVLCAATPGAQFPKANGLKFEIDGKTQYFAGTNSYWLPFLMDNGDIDLTLDHLAGAGLKILRTWGFNDVTKIPSKGQPYFQSFEKGKPAPIINTGPEGLGRLDYVVKAAEKRGIKLIIPFINNWKDYGGMDAYMQFFNVPINSKTNLAWYQSDACQKHYQKYIKAVVSRYANSTAIFAWELANEPRCNGCDTKVVTEWATKTSRYVKSLDSKHMVTLGDEGFGLPGGKEYPYSFGEGVNFVENLKIKDLDFGTLHLYPESWQLPVAKGSEWVKNHAAACAKAKKPCLFEEYGVADKSKCANIGPWQKTSLSTPGMGADLYWQAGDVFKWGKSNNDGHAVYPGDENWQCMVVGHGKEVKAKAA